VGYRVEESKERKEKTKKKLFVFIENLS